MNAFSWDLQRAIEKYGFLPVKLWKNSKYQKDHFYWCTYWSKWYQVLDAEYEWSHLKHVTVKWHDGHIATHCTSLRSSDWELAWPDGVVIWDSDFPPEPLKEEVLIPSDDVLLLDYELTE